MPDNLNDEQRSACMRAVKAKNTTPEMAVRRLIHSMGYRYALHVSKLPGKPDIVLTSKRKIIFVHGCFWHNHNCKRGRRPPATNSIYWNTKRKRNQSRDRVHLKRLREEGWKVLVVWECQIQDLGSLRRKLSGFIK